jgi:hypothetical protein
MNNAIGLGLLLYCVIFCGYSLWVKEGAENFVPDPRFYLQLLVSGLGGLSVLVYSNFGMALSVCARIKAWCRSANPILPSPPNPVKDKTMKDHEVLAYLKGRIKTMNSDRGMELLIELNTLLFSYDEEEGDEGEQ